MSFSYKTHRRQFALISIAALCAASSYAGAQAAILVNPPTVAGITVTPRYARFHWEACAGDCSYDSNGWSAWVFDRLSGQWTTQPPRKTKPNFEQHFIAYEKEKPIRLTGTHTLSFTGRNKAGDMVFMVSENGQQPVPVIPEVSAAERWRVISGQSLALRYFDGTIPSIDPYVTAWKVAPDAIWFGLSGHPLHPGGLTRFDRRTHTTTAILDSVVSTSRVMDIAVTRRAVWIAADVEDTWSERRGRGLIRYDQTSHAWKYFTSSNSPLPDDDVVKLATAGDSVFIATRYGVAVYDDKSGRWNTRYVTVTARTRNITESIAGTGYTDDDGQRKFEMAERPHFYAHWSLSTRRQNDAPRERALVGLGRQLRPVAPESEFTRAPFETVIEPDSFISLIRSVPSKHFEPAWIRGELDVERALSHPRLTPIIAATIHGDSSYRSWDRRSIAALGWLRDTTFLPLLQDLASQEATDDPSLAFALARMGDTTGVVTLRRWLADGLAGYGRDEILGKLVQLGDTVTAASLARRALDDADESAYSLLYRVATRKQWRAALENALKRPSASRAVVNAIYNIPVDSIAPDAQTRSLLAKLAIAVVGDTTNTSSDYSDQIAPTHAAELMVALRDPSVVPVLISAVNTRHYVRAMGTLIQLTGVVDKSASLSATPDQKLAAQRFWTTWWREHARGFVPVQTTVGESALRQWITDQVRANASP